MDHLQYYPLLFFELTLLLMLAASFIGARLHSNKADLEEGARQDFDVVLAATLTLHPNS